MKLSVAAFGDNLKTKKTLGLKEFLRIIILIIVIALLVFAGIFVYRKLTHSEEKKLSKIGVSKPVQFEKAGKDSTNIFLQNKNYESYIDSQISLAAKYDAANDYKNAIRVMSEVFDSVPADKVTTMAYSEMANLQQEDGNTQQYKNYLSLLEKKYIAEGNTQAAEGIKSTLDSIK